MVRHAGDNRMTRALFIVFVLTIAGCDPKEPAKPSPSPTPAPVLSPTAQHFVWTLTGPNRDPATHWRFVRCGEMCEGHWIAPIVPATCDFDGDNDVDLKDYAAFMRQGATDVVP